MVLMQADCGNGDQGLRGLHPVLIILRQATIETEPREAALDDPCQPSDRENTLPALEDSQLPAIALELAGELAARVASIRDDRADSRPKRCQAGQQPEAGNRVRHVRRLNAVGERKAEHIDQNVAFPSFHPLVAIEAANAPFSLVLTD